MIALTCLDEHVAAEQFRHVAAAMPYGIEHGTTRRPAVIGSTAIRTSRWSSSSSSAPACANAWPSVVKLTASMPRTAGELEADEIGELPGRQRDVEGNRCLTRDAEAGPTLIIAKKVWATAMKISRDNLAVSAVEAAPGPLKHPPSHRDFYGLVTQTV
jgi:hypothetical protein